MRILDIKDHWVILQVEKTELDNIVNDYLDLQYRIGYEEGFSDWQKACENADVDFDNPSEN